MFRIRSVLQAKDYRYLLLNAPDDKIADISAILPGMKSPTVMPLAKKRLEFATYSNQSGTILGSHRRTQTKWRRRYFNLSNRKNGQLI